MSHMQQSLATFSLHFAARQSSLFDFASCLTFDETISIGGNFLMQQSEARKLLNLVGCLTLA